MSGLWKKVVVFVLFVLVVLAASSPAIADGEEPQLRFMNEEFDPLAKPQPAAPSATPKITTLKSTSQAYYVVQFDGPIRQEWKDALLALNVKIFDYVPEFGFIIKADTSLENDIRAINHVRWLGPYSSQYKMSGKVNVLTPEKLAEEGYRAKLKVIVFSGENVADIQKQIQDLGGTVLEAVETDWDITFVILVPVQKTQALSSISGVKWIEPVSENKLFNNIGSDIMQVRMVRGKTWTRSSTKLFGEGQIVAICDTGLDTGVPATIHMDFQDGSGVSRVIHNEILSGASTADMDGHGTHVAGSVLGNGVRSGSTPASDIFPDSCYAGVAPKAKLYFQSSAAANGSLVGIPSNLNTLFQSAYNAGARIHTNSWGGSFRADYESQAVNVDQFMWNNKDFLVLFAAGNAGSDRNLDGVVDSHTVDAPGTAKNCLTVGASENLRATGGLAERTWGSAWPQDFPLNPITGDLISDKPVGLAGFSSRGPTVSGRYKPEVVAPGTNILSTRSSQTTGSGWGTFNQYYYYQGGTSMATPLAAGAAALMREYLIEEEESIATPSAALIKTALIHGATDLAPGQYGRGLTQETTSAPDIAQGWGRVDLESSMNSDPKRTIVYNDMTADVPTDDTYKKQFSFTVADAGAPFRATLGWTDYPGTTAAIGGLVNDLDLRVRKPDNSWVYPDNARNLGKVQRNTFVTNPTIPLGHGTYAMRFTPTSYPQLLDSVWVGILNPNEDTTPISLVVYSWTGTTVGEELYRQQIGYLSDQAVHLLPVGVSVSSGSVVVAVELGNSAMELVADSSNPSGRGLVQNAAGWETATVTPYIEGIFRTEAVATEFDRVNNTVSVTIDDPVPGVYTAEVTAYNIPQGPQPYALITSGLTSVVNTGGSASVECNSGQPDAPTVTVTSTERTAMSAVQISATHGVTLENVYADIVEFSGNITGNYGEGLVSMRYPVTGLPVGAAGALVLKKLLGFGSSLSFNYPKYEEYKDGNWWLSTAGGAFVDPEKTLSADDTYYVVSVVKDNGKYDANPAVNIVEDPQVLGGSSSGGSGGGCVIGSDNDWATTALILIAGLAILYRRRRQSRSSL